MASGLTVRSSPVAVTRGPNCVITMIVHGYWVGKFLNNLETIQTNASETIERFPGLEEWVEFIVEKVQALEYEDTFELKRDDTIPEGCRFIIDPDSPKMRCWPQ